MLTLIVREIRDNHVYFVLSCLLSAVIVAAMILMMVYGVNGEAIGTVYLCGGLQFTVLGVLGTTQMFGDRANRVSTLLSTQAVTRSRILVARILAGVAALLVALIPGLVACVLLLRLRVPPLEFYSRMVWDISIVLLLMGLACHGAGLLIGWTNSKARVLAGFPCLLLFLASLVVIKGFGLSAMLLLVLVLAVFWGRTWHTFTSASM
jgi:hypothetical protein